MPSPLPSISTVDSAVPPQSVREADRTFDGSESPFAGLMAQFTAPPPQSPPSEPPSPKGAAPVDGTPAARGAGSVPAQPPPEGVAGSPSPEKKGPEAPQKPAEGNLPGPAQAEAAGSALPPANPSAVLPALPSLPSQAPVLAATGPTPLEVPLQLPPLPEPRSQGTPTLPPPAAGRPTPASPAPVPTPPLPGGTPAAPSPGAPTAVDPTPPAPDSGRFMMLPPGQTGAPQPSPLPPVAPPAFSPAASEGATVPKSPAAPEPTAPPPEAPLFPFQVATSGSETRAHMVPESVTIQEVALPPSEPRIVLEPGHGGGLGLQSATLNPSSDPNLPELNLPSPPVSWKNSPPPNPGATVPVPAPSQTPVPGQRGPTLLETPFRLPRPGLEQVVTEPANNSVPGPTFISLLTPAATTNQAASAAKGFPAAAVQAEIVPEGPVATQVKPLSTPAPANFPGGPVSDSPSPLVPGPNSTAAASDSVAPTPAPIVLAPPLPATPAVPRNPANSLRPSAPEPSISQRVDAKESKDAQTKPAQEAPVRRAAESPSSSTTEGAKAPQVAPENPQGPAVHGEARLPSTPAGIPQPMGLPIQPATFAAAIIPATVSAPAHPVVIQVGDSLKWILRQANPSAELQLHPENLGKVTISLKVDGTSVHAKVWASEAATLPVLQDHRAYLEVSLRQQGLHLGSFDLQQGHRGHQPQGEAPPRAPWSPAVEGNAPLARQETPSTLATNFATSHRIEVLV